MNRFHYFLYFKYRSQKLQPNQHHIHIPPPANSPQLSLIGFRGVLAAYFCIIFCKFSCEANGKKFASFDETSKLSIEMIDLTHIMDWSLGIYIFVL